MQSPEKISACVAIRRSQTCFPGQTPEIFQPIKYQVPEEHGFQGVQRTQMK